MIRPKVEVPKIPTGGLKLVGLKQLKHSPRKLRGMKVEDRKILREKITPITRSA